MKKSVNFRLDERDLLLLDEMTKHFNLIKEERNYSRTEILRMAIRSYAYRLYTPDKLAEINLSIEQYIFERDFTSPFDGVTYPELENLNLGK